MADEQPQSQAAVRPADPAAEDGGLLTGRNAGTLVSDLPDHPPGAPPGAHRHRRAGGVPAAVVGQVGHDLGEDRGCHLGPDVGVRLEGDAHRVRDQ
jgi:hypothetical protein